MGAFWKIVLVLAALAAVLAIAGLWLVLGAWRRNRFRRRAEQAVRVFAPSREKLETTFLSEAAATGKPRGLAWKESRLTDAVVYAVDRATGDLYALSGVTIRFEAIEGGGMEEVEAVGNLRCATAVFMWRGRQWTTDGRAVFNLEPKETLERYRQQLDPYIP